MAGGRRVKVAVSEVAVPPVAWPTLAVFAGSLVAWTCGLLAGAVGGWPLAVTLPLQVAAGFAIFTPLHEATHGAAANAHRNVNAWVGRISALVLAAPYPAFRYVHLEHHKHTNDPDRDPDVWSGTRPALLMPLRWISQAGRVGRNAHVQAWHYFVPYIRMRHSRPVEEKREVLVTELAIVGTMVALAVAGYGWQVLYYYFLPNKLAIMLLAYAFDYVPHRPHKTARTEDEYRTTSKIDGLYGVKGLDLAVPLLFQNYHNIHHLYPQVPFYRYASIWNNHRDEFLAAGTPVAPFYDAKTPWLS